MNINTQSMVSITEANQNFSKIAKMVDDKGSVTILKNNFPKYVVINYEKLKKIEGVDNIDIDDAIKEFISENIVALKELAKWDY